VEIDAQELVSLWQAKASNISEATTILDDIEEIATAFTSFREIHIQRSSNFPACLGYVRELSLAYSP